MSTWLSPSQSIVAIMRTDRDNWDINTSVGSTALFVAASRALEATKPAPLAADQYAEVFCRAAGGEWAELVAGGVPEHPLRSEDFGQYFVSFQGARTRYFDTYFGKAIEAGVKQVVILASGLDSRAYRLDWAPGTTVFELDQPLVHQFKREALDQHGPSPRPSVRRSPSTCVRIGVRRYRTRGSIRPSRRPGLSKGC